MKSTLKDGAGKNLLVESTIFSGTFNRWPLEQKPKAKEQFKAHS